MLAYLFWHQPDEDVDRARYETALVAFHRALAERPPRGFLGSRAFRLDAVPWLDGRPGYGDWYLIEDSAALDPLNDAAVAAGMRVPHDAVARLAGDGAGGLYRSFRAGAADDRGAAAGDDDVEAVGPGGGPGAAARGGAGDGSDRAADLVGGERTVAVWLTKSRGEAYGSFTAELAAAAPEPCRIWQRQMVLGPAPEFCVVGDEEELDGRTFREDWRPLVVRRRLLTPR